MSENTDKPLTMRERLALRLILLAVVIVEPFKWSHAGKHHIDALRQELGDKVDQR